MKVLKKYNIANIIILGVVSLLLIGFYSSYINQEIIEDHSKVLIINNTTKIKFVMDFTSNMAYTVGEPIIVDVELFIDENYYDGTGVNGFVVYFYDSYPEPSQRYFENEGSIGKVPHFVTVPLKFSDEQHATGHGELYCSRPGNFGFEIFSTIDGALYNSIYQTDNSLDVAPFETRLQIKNNNIMLGVALVGLFFTIFEILLNFDSFVYKKKK